MIRCVHDGDVLSIPLDGLAASHAIRSVSNRGIQPGRASPSSSALTIPSRQHNPP